MTKGGEERRKGRKGECRGCEMDRERHRHSRYTVKCPYLPHPNISVTHCPALQRITLRSQYRQSEKMSLAERVALEKKAQNLVSRINSFHKVGKKLFPLLNLSEHAGAQWDHDEVEVCVCEEDCSCEELAELPMGRVVFNANSVEFSPLPLPSSFDKRPKGWGSVKEVEIRLRVAQAEEALEELRGDIGEKSYLYRAKRALAGGGKRVTRSYDEINAIEAKMRLRVKVYENARWALKRLGVADEYPRFRPLNRTNTKAITAVYNPNIEGERNSQLSWIWTMNVQQDSATDEYLAEGFDFSQNLTNYHSDSRLA